MTGIEAQLAELTRGTDEVLPEDGLEAKLKEGRPLIVKAGFFLFLFVWVRWSLPRFRFDQLMRLGWKVLLPLSLANLIVTGAFVAFLGGKS